VGGEKKQKSYRNCVGWIFFLAQFFEYFFENLETFSVDNWWARFVIFLLGNPHLLESGQRGQNGATDPDGVFALWRGDYFNLHGARGQSGNLLLHSVRNSGVHCGAAGKYGVSVKIFSDIHVAFHNWVISSFVDTGGFHTQEGWLEKSLRATETLVTNGDDL